MRSQNLMWGLPRGAPWSAPGRAPQLLGRALERSRRRRAGGRAEGFATLRVWLPRGVFFVFTLFFVCVHSAFFMCSLGVFVGVQSAFFSVFTRRFLMFHSAFCRCSLGDFHVFTRRFSGVHSAICRCSLLRFLVFTRRSGGRKLLAQHCGCRALRGREACDITSSPTRRDRYFVHIAACALWIEGVFGELSSLSLLGLAAKASATLSPDRTYFTSQCRLET